MITSKASFTVCLFSWLCTTSPHSSFSLVSSPLRVATVVSLAEVFTVLLVLLLLSFFRKFSTTLFSFWDGDSTFLNPNYFSPNLGMFWLFCRVLNCSVLCELVKSTHVFCLSSILDLALRLSSNTCICLSTSPTSRLSKAQSSPLLNWLRYSS